jgi:hypothetical protein
MRPESTLAFVALACAVLTPCTCGASAAPGVLLAAVGAFLAWRGDRSMFAPLFALLVNVCALALACALSAVAAVALFVGAGAAAYAGAQAAGAVFEHAPDAARSMWSALSPAGFWSEYRRDELVDHNSDQGPYGGRRWLRWRAEQEGAFEARDVARFAAEHGWTLHSSERVSVRELREWMATCQLPSAVCDPSTNHVPADLAADYVSLPPRLSRSPGNELEALSFDTGWVQYHDDFGLAWTVVGYAILSADGRELVVTHHWGE